MGVFKKAPYYRIVLIGPLEILPVRQQQVLRATVLHYVDTMEPVGSQTLIRRFSLEASSSTVRSDMGALENMGFLTQPHPSSGRIPSPQGYRHYVNCLLPPPGVAVQHLERELTNMSLRFAALDDLLWQMGRRLTDFTGLMSLITRPVRKQKRLEKVRLVQSGERLLVMLVESSNDATHLNVRLPLEAVGELDAMEVWLREQLVQSENGKLDWSSLPPHLYMSGKVLREAIKSHRQSKSTLENGAVIQGISQLVAQPEFTKSDTVLPLLELMDSQPVAVLPNEQSQCSGVWIGSEHPHEALADCAVVQASYRSSDDGIGQVALIGPMRMAYSTAIAAVSKVTDHLNRVLS